MDGWNGQNNEETDKYMGGQTNALMDMQYMCIKMQKTMIFQQFYDFYKSITDRPMNRRTDGRTVAQTYPLMEMQ